MTCPFHLEPALQLDLEVPIRIEVFVPLDLLPRFHPSIRPVSVPGNIRDIMSPRNPLEAIKPAALTIAELVSRAVFGSAEAIQQPFQPVGHWGRDGTLEGILLFLNHRLTVDDRGLNPEYILMYAHDADGQLVLRPCVLTGERRKLKNEFLERTAGTGPEISML
jgi:hypothetical protein